jgi:transcriptional regulator with XRE-family HTH domain
LAARAGTPTSTVSRIEAEQHDPTLLMLERLLAAAGGQLVVEVRYDDEHPTIAELVIAVDRESGRLKIDWTRLRAFADWADRHTDELADAITSPPARTGTPLDAILAALADELDRLDASADVVMVGGSWMLWHSRRASTRDVALAHAERQLWRSQYGADGRVGQAISTLSP